VGASYKRARRLPFSSAPLGSSPRGYHRFSLQPRTEVVAHPPEVRVAHPKGGQRRLWVLVAEQHPDIPKRYSEVCQVLSDSGPQHLKQLPVFQRHTSQAGIALKDLFDRKIMETISGRLERHAEEDCRRGHIGTHLQPALEGSPGIIVQWGDLFLRSLAPNPNACAVREPADRGRPGGRWFWAGSTAGTHSPSASTMRAPPE